jgi:hypothetical protein
VLGAGIDATLDVAPPRSAPSKRKGRGK